jgi:uncharacterized protein (TIGR00645 family)
MSQQQPIDRNPYMAVMAQMIFWSRWLQAPLYLGLIVAQGVYVFLFIKELIHLIAEANTFTESEIMLLVLGLIDVVMIANLLIMVIIGGYETFVSRLNLKEHPDQPQWLAHVNATTMKIKLSMALIGISSIHLLKSFINAEHMEVSTIKWQVIIHLTFIVSAIAMAVTDYIMNKSISVSREYAH